MRNKTPLKILTLILFIISLSLGIIGYKYNIDHPEILSYVVLGPKNGYEFMKVYKEVDGSLCINNCQGETYLIIMNERTNSEAQLVVGNKDTKYLLINNNKVKLINMFDRTEKIIPEIPQGSYSLILSDGSTYNQDNLKLDAIGITFNSGKIKGYYNLITDKIMYDGIYDNITVLNKDYLINTTEDKITLLNIDEEKEVLELECNKNYALRKIETENEKAYITLLNSSNNKTIYQIYDLNTKTKIGEFEGVFEKITKTGDKIITLLEQEVIVYNEDGTIFQKRTLSASDKHNMIDNFYVTIEKNKLMLIDLETNIDLELMDMPAFTHLDRVYKDVITLNDGNTNPALRIVVREINDGAITKTYNIFYNLKTKEFKIEED